MAARLELPSRIEFIEVGLRDGLQSIDSPIPTDEKIRLAEMLAACGVPRIELTSFVSPRAIPQLADAAEVVAGVSEQVRARARYLIPNLRGLERAVQAGAKNVVVVTSATDAFNRANLNRSVDETLAEIARLVPEAAAHGIKTDGVVSVSFFCPYQGRVKAGRVSAVVGRLQALGIFEISIADTIGAANPAQVFELFSRLRSEFPKVAFDAHFHDTRGLALANALAALQAGVGIFEGSVGGIGGCPYAPGASGNICSEDLLLMFEQMGIHTGIEIEKLVAVARHLERLLGRELPGKVLRAKLLSPA